MTDSRMSDAVTVEATLDIEMFVTCPNEECGYYIDLMKASDTNGVMHNDDSALMRQLFPKDGTNNDFSCEEVTCTKCKTVFNVKGLWC